MAKSKNQETDKVEIAGVKIKLSNIDTKKVKDTRGIAKLNIFSHLEGDEKTNAEAELASRLGIGAHEEVIEEDDEDLSEEGEESPNIR